MRLLNVYTFTFATFNQYGDVPPYAIASHRSCRDEATYLDVLEGRNRQSDGFKKIRVFCDFAKEQNRAGATPRIEWIWIDTCCIDRRSSQEVSESILSMYRYYEQSTVCYVYLFDVPSPARFEESSWFTRGWTLQELLVPSKVIFIRADGKVYGHKCLHGCERGCNNTHSSRRTYALTGPSLNHTISEITGVSLDILNTKYRAQAVDPADVCKWIHQRETLRLEDLAYCILGLLGVYMSPMYGEGGDRAWWRLEQEVRRQRGYLGSLAKPRQLVEDDEGENDDDENENDDDDGDDDNGGGGMPPRSDSYFDDDSADKNPGRQSSRSAKSPPESSKRYNVEKAKLAGDSLTVPFANLSLSRDATAHWSKSVTQQPLKTVSGPMSTYATGPQSNTAGQDRRSPHGTGLVQVPSRSQHFPFLHAATGKRYRLSEAEKCYIFEDGTRVQLPSSSATRAYSP